MPVKLHRVFISRIIYRDIAAAVGNHTLHNLTDFPTPFQNCPPSTFLHVSCVTIHPFLLYSSVSCGQEKALLTSLSEAVSDMDQ